MTSAFSLTTGFPPTLGWMALIALLLSAIGFYRFVYFISIGYGLSVAGIATFLLLSFRDHFDAASVVLLVLLVVYGLRLSGYLLVREWRSAAYRRTLARETKREKPMPPAIQVMIWVSVSALYVAQTSPAAYLLTRHATGGQEAASPLTWVGIVLAGTGLLLESLADAQKSAAKRKRPERWVDGGLYKIVRCPNYLGEVLLWLGIYLAGMPGYASGWSWVVATTGFVMITYVMLSGARRLERGQDARYGDQPEYRAYTSRTPILLPLVPWYSMKHWDFIKDA